MPSAKQVLAARTNGLKSQGPKTPEGRRKSSANSRKHGLYGKDIPTDEACEAYRESLLYALIAKYRPANPIELTLIETIALAGARQNWAIRTSEACLAQAIEAQANPEAPCKHPGRNKLLMLRRLENRLYRQEMRPSESAENIENEGTNPVHSRGIAKMHERTGFLSRETGTNRFMPPASPAPPYPRRAATHEPPFSSSFQFRKTVGPSPRRVKVGLNVARNLIAGSTTVPPQVTALCGRDLRRER